MDKKHKKKNGKNKKAVKAAEPSIVAKEKEPEKKSSNGKHAGGRPTLYKPEFINELIKFYDVTPYEDVPIEHYQRDGKTLKWTDKKRMPRMLPTLVGFARKYGLGTSTVYDWINPKHASYQKEFSAAYNTHAKRLQKDFLIQNGLQGLYNPLAFKFVAINETDMRDTQEQIHKIPGITEPLTLDDMKARIAAAEAQGLSGLDSRSINGGGQ